MSLETKVMRSYMLVCDVIRDAAIQDIYDAAARNEIQITNADFAKLTQIIQASVARSSMNSANQLQSIFKEV